jgi:hypothetical protein
MDTLHPDGCSWFKVIAHAILYLGENNVGSNGDIISADIHSS